MSELSFRIDLDEISSHHPIMICGDVLSISRKYQFRSFKFIKYYDPFDGAWKTKCAGVNQSMIITLHSRKYVSYVIKLLFEIEKERIIKINRDYSIFTDVEMKLFSIDTLQPIPLFKLGSIMTTDGYIFNSKTQRVLKKVKPVTIIQGRLIETNHLDNIVDKFGNNNLVISPDNLRSYWDRNSNQVINIQNFSSFTRKNEWNYLIFSEMYQIPDNIIQNMTKIRYRMCFVINCLPIKYDVFTRIKMVSMMCTKNEINEIKKFCLLHFDQYYLRVPSSQESLDTTSSTISARTIIIEPSEYEQKIYSRISNTLIPTYDRYLQSKYELGGFYLTEEGYHHDRQHLFFTTMEILFSSGDEIQAKGYIQRVLQDYMTEIFKIENEIEDITFIMRNNQQPLEYMNVIQIAVVLKKLNDRKRYLLSIVKNHQIENDNHQCPICYSNDVNVRLLCNHQLCDECIFSLLQRNRQCPVCRVKIERNHFPITINHRMGSIMYYFSSIVPDTLIITNVHGLSHTMNATMKIIELQDNMLNIPSMIYLHTTEPILFLVDKIDYRITCVIYYLTLIHSNWYIIQPSFVNQ